MLHEMSKVIQLIAVLTTVVAIALANEELFGNLKDRSTKEAHGREISVADRIRSYQAQALHSVSSVFETVQFKNDTHGKLAPSARIKPAEDALPDINELRQLLVPKIKVPDVFALATAAPAFTCQSLPQPYDPHYFCAGVVDYPFIVADGVTVLDMEMQARQAVMYLTSFINAPCLSDMKRLLCSSLYQPCVGNVEAGNVASYMPTEVPAVVTPYIRPCGSLCVAVTHYGTTCGYIIEAFGLARDCLAADPSTGLMVYDFASTPLSVAYSSGAHKGDGTFTVPVCNDLPTSIGYPTVHDPKEPYTGSMCESITHELYVPASAALDPTLAPFLPPYVLQAQIEGTIAKYESINPNFWTADCRLARREYLCGAFFSAPHPDETLAMYFGTVYIPSYPAREVCEKYEDECPVLNTFFPAECNQTLPSGAQVFPATDQVVFSFDLGFGPMHLYSPPQYIANVTMVLPTECPYGTVVPEDPSRSRSIPNVGTGCSLSCPSRTLRDSEYDTLNIQRRAAYWFGLVISLLQIANLSILKRARQNIFVLCAVIGIFLTTLLTVIQIELFDGHAEDSVCSSNASWYDVFDFGESLGNNLCTVTALFTLYQVAFMYWVLVTLSIEIWLRVTKGVKEKDINSWRLYYLTIAGACSLAYALLNTLYGHPNITVQGLATFSCAWVPNSGDKRFYANTIFEIACFAVSMSLFLHVVYVCVKTSLSVVDAEKKPLKKIWKSYSMIFLFLALHFILYSVTIFYMHVKLFYVDSDATSKSEMQWYSCLFDHFFSSEDDTYLHICGDVPSVRASLSDYIIEVPIVYFTSLVLLYITFYKDVREFWHMVFLRIVAFVGIKFVALKLLGEKQAGLFTIARNRASSVFSSSGQSDIEMEEGTAAKALSGKPTMATGMQSLNPFAKTGVPRTDSYLPDNYSDLKKELKLVQPAQGSEIETERGTARDSEHEGSQRLSGPRTSDLAQSAGQSGRMQHSGSGGLNIPDTILSEADATNVHSIYTTLPSFDGAAEALAEIAAINAAVTKGGVN